MALSAADIKMTERDIMETASRGNKSLIGMLQEDSRLYIENLLWVIDIHRRLVPFQLNPTQQALDLHYKKHRKSGKQLCTLILKARKEGVTTYEQARSFWCVANYPNFNAATLAHKVDDALAIFRIATTFYRHLAKDFKPVRKGSSDDEIFFNKLNSSYWCMSAGSGDIGRGRTIWRVHGSEVAYWRKPDKIVTGLMNALPEDSEITLESTPNGPKGWFFDEWRAARRGKSEFIPVFFPWWINQSYRLPLEKDETVEPDDDERYLIQHHGLDSEQIKWRRKKKMMVREFFQQEFPENDEECWLDRKGLVFSQFRKRLHVIPPPDVNPEKLGIPIFAAIDVGAYPGAFVRLSGYERPEDGALIIFDEYWSQDRRYSEHAASLKKRPYRPKITWSDPKARQGRLELGHLGIKTYPAENAIDHGIYLVQSLLSKSTITGKPLLYITSNCRKLIEQIEGLRYTDKNRPEDMDNDTTDTLRYLVASMFRMKRRMGKRDVWFGSIDPQVLKNL